MLPTKFRFIWSKGFRGEEFKKSINQKQESPVAAMIVNGSGWNEQSLQRTFHRCFLSRFGSFGHAVSEEKTYRSCILPSFGSFGHAVSEEKIFRNRPIRNKNWLWWPYLLMDQDEMSNLNTGPSIDASY